jgi:cysteine synthase A
VNTRVSQALTRRPPAHSLVDLIGGTPTVRLDLGVTTANLYAKLEMANPLSSVKDRAALYMINGAE